MAELGAKGVKNLKPVHVSHVLRKELGLGYRKLVKVPIQANSERCLVLRQQYALKIFQLLASGASDQQLLHDLYQRALSRQPAAEAEQQLLDYVQSNPDRRKAWEDVLWTILNSKEFVYKH